MYGEENFSIAFGACFCKLKETMNFRVSELGKNNWEGGDISAQPKKFKTLSTF